MNDEGTITQQSELDLDALVHAELDWMIELGDCRATLETLEPRIVAAGEALPPIRERIRQLRTLQTIEQTGSGNPGASADGR